MYTAVLDMLSSKKFLAALVSMIAFAAGHWGIEVDTDTMLKFLAPVVAYIVAQGIADHGKSAAQVDAKALGNVIKEAA